MSFSLKSPSSLLKFRNIVLACGGSHKRIQACKQLKVKPEIPSLLVCAPFAHPRV